MSRSGYSDDCETIWLYRRAVDNAIGGKRGQAFLRELIETLEVMPVPRLVTDVLEMDGEVCALGAVGVRRGLDMTAIDPEDADSVARAFGVASCLAQEIVYLNDELGAPDTPEQRWGRIRAWAQRCLTKGKQQ